MSRRQSKRRSDDFSDQKVLKITDIILKKFVKKRGIDYGSFEDFRQEVLEKFYSKKTAIIDSYSGKAKPETYLSAVIYRMVLGVIRSDKNFKKYQSDINPAEYDMQTENVRTPEENLVIKNEKLYLKALLKTLPESDKTVLFLKAYFRIVLSNADLEFYRNSEALQELNEKLQQADKINDKDIYDCLCRAENCLREMPVKPDAIRMYIQKNIDILLARLNGRKTRSFYTKESLAFLFEIVFCSGDYHKPTRSEQQTL